MRIRLEVNTIMEKEKLLELLNRVYDFEKSFDVDPTLKFKTISKNTDFQKWRTELKSELQKMKQDVLVGDILQLLNNRFKNGFTDEKDFKELKGEIDALSSNLDNYFEEQLESEVVVRKMKKGTVVKTAFDEYILDGQIGQGGNGKVFSAKNANEKLVAIKFIERNISNDKLKRFKNEIYFCEGHKNKNIVTVIDRGYVVLDKKEYVFYVMPLYAETLRDKMKAKLEPDDIVTIFIGIINGLRYAHKFNVIHRDIKPENIMFKEDSLEPIICDFGIAQFAEDEMLTIVETKKDARMANFQYAAPEQRSKGDVAIAQTDIYAAALILNEMFTGEIPQAEDYKKIESVAPSYKYLDDVFVQIFKQNASERLYPEEKILTELKVRAEQYHREQEKLKLQNVVNDTILPDAFNAIVLDKEFVDGKIVFKLNSEIPDEWFSILLGGEFGNHIELVGYGPNKLQKYDKCGIAMPIQGSESPDNIKTIVENVIDWIERVNIKYSKQIKHTALEKQREREARRKAEIERLDRENSINAILSQI